MMMKDASLMLLPSSSSSSFFFQGHHHRRLLHHQQKLLPPPLLHHSQALPSNPPLSKSLPLPPCTTIASIPPARSMASSDSGKDLVDPPPPFGVLFVCLGNICRSPTAEAVFRYAVDKRGLGSMFNIDSAGTINYHEGEPADARMKAAAIKRGVKLTSISRPIRPSDFKEFDLILAMDKQNKGDILKAYDRWNSKQALPPNAEEKVKLMCSYCKNHEETEVPDPYYGGADGFEKVLDLLEDACESLLDFIIANITKDEKDVVKRNL